MGRLQFNLHENLLSQVSSVLFAVKGGVTVSRSPRSAIFLSSTAGDTAGLSIDLVLGYLGDLTYGGEVSVARVAADVETIERECRGLGISNHAIAQLLCGHFTTPGDRLI